MSSNISNIIDSSENKLSKWKDDVKKDLQEIKNEIKDEINDTLSSLEHHITGAASERSPLLHKMKKGKDANNNNDNDNNNNEGRSNSSPSKLSYTPKEEEEAAEKDATGAAVVVTDDEEHIAASMNTTKSDNSKQTVPPNNNNNNSQGGITQLILITLLSTSTIYQTILHKLDIVSNSIPFIVAVHWCILTFFIGVSTSSSFSSSLRDGGMTMGMTDTEDVEGGGASVVDQHYQQERHVTFSARQQEQEHQKRSSNTRDLIRRIPMGRRHYAKMKESLFTQKQLQHRDSPLLEEFFTNLKPAFKNITPRFSGGSGSSGSDSGGEVTPLSEGMMIRLLKYSPDFGRRKSQMGEIDNSIRASCRRVQEEEEVGDSGSGSEEEEEVNYEMGTAPLGNIRASKLERDFGEVVVPMCKFRGMDFFVGDFPEKEIWKQPLLLK